MPIVDKRKQEPIVFGGNMSPVGRLQGDRNPICPRCNLPLSVVPTGKYGPFLACGTRRCTVMKLYKTKAEAERVAGPGTYGTYDADDYDPDTDYRSELFADEHFACGDK